MVFSKVFWKFFQISLGNTCTENNVNLKFWLYAFSIPIIKDTLSHSFFQTVLEIFKKTFLLVYSWASVSEFIFDIFKSNKYIKVSFLLTFLYRKIKTKQENWVPLKRGNPRFALQGSSHAKQMFGIDKMSPLLLRINLPHVFTIYIIWALRKLWEDFQEDVLGGVILLYNRYSVSL